MAWSPTPKPVGGLLLHQAITMPADGTPQATNWLYFPPGYQTIAVWVRAVVDAGDVASFGYNGTLPGTVGLVAGHGTWDGLGSSSSEADGYFPGVLLNTGPLVPMTDGALYCYGTDTSASATVQLAVVLEQIKDVTP